MAQINIPTKVTGPDQINVDLIRADYAEMSHTFRICFEVSLSLFSAVLGHVLSIEKVEFIHYFTLIVLGIFTITFLILSSQYHNKAKCKPKK